MHVGCCVCIGESGGTRGRENNGGQGISPPKVDTEGGVLSIGLEWTKRDSACVGCMLDAACAFTKAMEPGIERTTGVGGFDL